MILHAGRLPAPARSPLLLVKVVGFGALTGIGLSLGYTLLAGTCGIPGMILPGLLAQLPQVHRRILIALAGGIDATLAMMLAV